MKLSAKVVEWEEQWDNCKLCRLHKKRSQVVHWKGNLPADILLFGEAPGSSEDVIGIPFVGVAGKLLEEIMDDVDELCVEHKIDLPTACIANVIGCQPPGNRPPLPDELSKCSPRVERLIKLAGPKMIVFMGRTAKSKKNVIGEGIPHVDITHPAFIARSDRSSHVPMIMNSAAKIFSGYRDIVTEKVLF